MLSVGCLVVALTRPLLMLVTIGAVSQPGLALCGRTDWLRPPPPDTTDTVIPAKHIVIYADKLNHKVQDLLLFCTLLAQPEAPMCQMCPQCAEIGAMIDTWHCTVGWAGLGSSVAQVARQPAPPQHQWTLGVVSSCDIMAAPEKIIFGLLAIALQV